MSNKVSKKENKKKEDNRSMIIAIVFGCFTMGIVIGILISGLSKGGGSSTSRSGKKATGGELVDYQKEGLIELGEYKGLPMSLEVTDEDIEYEMEFLLEDNPEQLDGPAKNGDLVNIDFVGKVDGVEFEDGTSEDEELEIGANEYVGNFEEQIIGMKAGETRDITVTFPSDYGDEELDGKEAVFTVTLNYVVGGDSQFDDAFVQKISDGEYQTVEEYKEYMREYLKEENIDCKADTYWEMVKENIDFQDVDEGEYNKAYEETVNMYTNFAEVYEGFSEEYGSDEEMEDAAYDLAYERMAAKTIAKIENIEMSDEFYRETLLKELDNEELGESTIKELEDEYKNMCSSDPKDDILVIKVKEYLAETATISN